MYICMYAHVYLNIYVYVCICVCMYIYVYVCMYVYCIYTEQNNKRNTFVFAPIFHELNSKI